MTFDDKLFEIAAYTLPALITGGVAFVMMQKFYTSEESKRITSLIDTVPRENGAFEKPHRKKRQFKPIVPDENPRSGNFRTA
jgi:hypothetical protein